MYSKNKKEGSDLLLRADGIMLTDDIEKAELLNSCFDF
jgi:transketolase C-terminal domain/subunit